MMKIRDKSINAWQIGILLFVLMFANKILTLPSLLYDGAGVESFVIVIFLFGVEFGILILFWRLKKKYPTQSFSQILTQNFGKAVSFVVAVLIMIFFLSKTVLLYNITYIFFRNLIYKDADNFLFLLCFLPVVNHLAICGLRVLGRTAQMFFPIIVLIVLFCVVVGVFGINSMPLLYETSVPRLFNTTLTHLSSFGDIIFLFVVMDKIKVKNGEWKVVFSLVAVAMLCVLAITVIFIFSYTYTAFMHPYALFEIMSYVKEYGGVGRIDIISMVLIVLFTYFHLAIYLKAFMMSFCEILPKIDDIYCVLTFNFAFILLVSFLIQNLQKTLIYGTGILPYFAIIPFVVVPILSIICLLKQDRKRKRLVGR